MDDVTRIKDLPKTATTADLKVGNYVAIDGAEGTMKFPAENLKKEKAVFNATPDVTTYSEISSAIEKGQDVVVVSRGNVYRLNETITPNFVFERSEVRDNGDVYLNVVSVNSSDVWSSDNTQIAKKTDVPGIPTPPTTGTYFLVSVNGVMTWVETDVTSILKVAELPETPIDTTMYAVVEEEATTASDASETDSEV